jgi:hypothetical protein
MERVYLGIRVPEIAPRYLLVIRIAGRGHPKRLTINKMT